MTISSLYVATAGTTPALKRGVSQDAETEKAITNICRWVDRGQRYCPPHLGNTISTLRVRGSTMAGNQLFDDNVAETAKLRRQLLRLGWKRIELDVRGHDSVNGNRECRASERGRLLRDHLGNLCLLIERQKSAPGSGGVGRSLRPGGGHSQTDRHDGSCNSAHFNLPSVRFQSPKCQIRVVVRHANCPSGNARNDRFAPPTQEIEMIHVLHPYFYVDTVSIS
jgi:hypothetical protein